MNATRKFHAGQVVLHNDPLMGAEKVKVLDYLQVTTASEEYYLVQFLEDGDKWLCFESDLSEII